MDAGEAPTGAGEGRRRIPASDRNIVLFGLGVLAVVALFLWLPDLAPQHPELQFDQAHGRVATIEAAATDQVPKASVTLLDGARAGQTVDAIVEGPSGQLQLPDYRLGDEVLVAVDQDPDGTLHYSIVDRWRLPLIGGLLALFGVVAVVVAGWRGLRALVSLALTLAITVRLLIPLLLAGWDPVWLAIGIGVVVTVVTFLLTQGPSRTTLTAVLGTTIGLGLTGLLAVLVTALARFTPAQGSDTLISLQQVVGGTINMSGLLLAAVIFGALGVLNDVTIGQATTVEELVAADPSLGRRQLYGRAMNVGVAHVGATINTLVFAYLGTALPLLVLLALQVHAFSLAINQELLAVEIVRALVGSIGVLATVPITTLLACWWLTRPRAAAVPSVQLGSHPSG
ncbi:MAG: YibE/F family protein [Candidatus Limnocylindrales bacterium]